VTVPRAMQRDMAMKAGLIGELLGLTSFVPASALARVQVIDGSTLADDGVSKLTLGRRLPSMAATCRSLLLTVPAIDSRS
jgi:hypothetical protein